MNRLRQKYENEVKNQMVEKFGYKSVMQIPTIDKIVINMGIGDAVKQDRIFAAEEEAIRELAEKKNCVIVGRCSDYILHKANKKSLFSVHIYAPIQVRKNFGMEQLEIRPDKIDDYIIRVDTGRSEFYKRHTGVSFSSMTYRDMMINSESVPKEEIADIICYMAKKKFAQIKKEEKV